MFEGGAAAIAIEKQLINDLNVFPVPDGDTGTNMTLTMGAGVTELQKKQPTTVGQAAEVTASALLRGARGNSGVILSLLFRGLSKGLKDMEKADAKSFAAAMVDGVDAAYKAVMKPAEGTILTVSRITSNAAIESAANEADVELVLEYAIAVGYKALAKTIDQNPVLKKAGVVDAGGKGYLLILEGMLRALRGEEIGAPDLSAMDVHTVDFSDFDHEDITFTYCTEFLINRENKRDPHALRLLLDEMGDSLVVVDDDELIKVHVHTDDPGKALSEALPYGGLMNIKIENMRLQHAEAAGEQQGGETPPAVAAPEKPVGIMVVSAGPGMEAVFRDLGADQLVTGGQTMNPCTEEIVRAVNQVPAETVYVFPNNKNIILAAQQAIPLCEKHVVVVPTHSIPQGVAALLVFDPGADEATNTAAMGAATAAVKTIQVTYAARDADFDGHNILEGQFLALQDNAILTHANDWGFVLDKITAAVSESGPEFITIFYGEDVDETDAEACAKALRRVNPGAEITVIKGGQPVYFYMISVE